MMMGVCVSSYPFNVYRAMYEIWWVFALIFSLMAPIIITVYVYYSTNWRPFKKPSQKNKHCKKCGKPVYDLETRCRWCREILMDHKNNIGTSLHRQDQASKLHRYERSKNGHLALKETAVAQM